MKRSPSLLDRIKEVREKVVTYRCDKRARKALDRLLGTDDRGLTGLAEMKLDPDQLNLLLMCACRAVAIKGDFSEMLAGTAISPKRTKKLRQAITDLRQFVREMMMLSINGASASTPLSRTDQRNLADALATMEWLIQARERIAKETPKRIGATRKSAGKVARENAAIGWLADSVNKIAGKPYYRQACALCEILLGITEISQDRLRGAAQNFDREWRQN